MPSGRFAVSQRDTQGRRTARRVSAWGATRGEGRHCHHRHDRRRRDAAGTPPASVNSGRAPLSLLSPGCTRLARCSRAAGNPAQERLRATACHVLQVSLAPMKAESRCSRHTFVAVSSLMALIFLRNKRVAKVWSPGGSEQQGGVSVGSSASFLYLR